MGCVARSNYGDNKLGKGDAEIGLAVLGVKRDLNKKLRKMGLDADWRVVSSPSISQDEILKYIEFRGAEVPKTESIEAYKDSKMVPDGGILWLSSRKTQEKYPILISEMKYQGTNAGRLAAGQKKQASGNAIERLGKYILSYMQLYSKDKGVFPFITFCAGCDFNVDEEGLPKGSATLGAKLHSMTLNNKFNVIYTRDKMPNSTMLPCSILARENIWTVPELYRNMTELANDSFDYFVGVIKAKKNT